MKPILPFALILLTALAGCRWPRRSEPPKPIAERITWCSRGARAVSDSAPSDTGSPAACVGIQRLEFPGTDAPFRIELRRYRAPYWAFATWQNLGAQGRPQDGFVRVGRRWAFVHGSYLGLTDSTAGDLYPEEFRERLAFTGEPSFVLPSEFEAFPLLGRIPGSERIFMRDFLGRFWRGPVFSVAYPCHGDTALAFRAFPQNADSLSVWMHLWKGQIDTAAARKEKRFSGQDEFGLPMILSIFPEGILGVSGCFDSQLGQEYVEKMRKTQVFWHDP